MVGGLLVVLHVLSVFWLLAGIVGRDVVMARAARASGIEEVRMLLGVSHVFEARMVRPATSVVLVGGLLAAWARGWPILGFLQGSASNWVLVSLLIFLTITPVIVFVFLPRGRVFRRALDEAIARNQVTPELRAAFGDRAVAAARTYEMSMVVVITILMVTRPF
jgi:hypothetical protein